jgi:ligand-binding SRPBCC domain-containing protein
LRFQIRTPRPITIHEGARIEYSLWAFGIPLRWQSLIRCWDPPREFVDEQLAGPYKQWIHTHRFVHEDGGTAIEDDVRYDLPFQPLGELAYPLVKRQLAKIFHFGQQAIERLLLPEDLAGAGASMQPFCPPRGLEAVRDILPRPTASRSAERESLAPSSVRHNDIGQRFLEICDTLARDGSGAKRDEFQRGNSMQLFDALITYAGAVQVEGFEIRNLGQLCQILVFNRRLGENDFVAAALEIDAAAQVLNFRHGLLLVR